MTQVAQHVAHGGVLVVFPGACRFRALGSGFAIVQACFIQQHRVASGCVLRLRCGRLRRAEGRCAPPGGAATLGAFHKGAFAVALASGAPVWAMLQLGTDDFAPTDAFAGGFPARITARLVQLRPRVQPSAADPSPAALAETCRAAMQRELDDMLASKQAARGDAKEPLLPR